MTDDGASWAPVWSPIGDAIAFLHIHGPDRRPQAGPARRHRSGLDGQGRHRPDRGVRPRRRVAARTGSSRPTSCPRRASPDARPSERRPRALATDGPVTPTYLERLGRRGRPRSAAVLCLGLDPDPTALPAGFSRGPGRGRAVRDAASSRPPARTRRRSSRTWRSTRRSGRPGMAALERIRGRIPADIPVVIDAKRGDIGSTAARQAVALFDRLGADAVTVNPYLGRRGHRAAARARRPLRLRPVPDLEPRRGRAPGPRRRRRSRRPARRPSRSTRGSRGASRRWGPGGTVGLVVGATAPGRAARDPGGRARAGVPRARGRRPGRRDRAGPARRSGDGRAGRRATGRRAAGQRVARDQRGGRRQPADGGPDDPGERLAAAARDWARASLCYPSPRRAPSAQTRRIATDARFAGAPHHANTRTPRAGHHPGDRAPHPRPRQAARRRRRARQEHPRVPQGLDRRPGSGQRRRRHVAAARQPGPGRSRAAAAAPVVAAAAAPVAAPAPGRSGRAPSTAAAARRRGPALLGARRPTRRTVAS